MKVLFSIYCPKCDSVSYITAAKENEKEEVTDVGYFCNVCNKIQFLPLDQVRNPDGYILTI